MLLQSPLAVGAPLQFDHAESGDGQTAAPACSVCKAEIRDAYYDAGGEVFCRRCREARGAHRG